MFLLGAKCIFDISFESIFPLGFERQLYGGERAGWICPESFSFTGIMAWHGGQGAPPLTSPHQAYALNSSNEGVKPDDAHYRPLLSRLNESNTGHQALPLADRVALGR